MKMFDNLNIMKESNCAMENESEKPSIDFINRDHLAYATFGSESTENPHNEKRPKVSLKDIMKAEKPVPMNQYNSKKYFPEPVLNKSMINPNDVMILPEGFDNIIREIIPSSATPYKDLTYMDCEAEYETSYEEEY